MRRIVAAAAVVASVLVALTACSTPGSPVRPSRATSSKVARLIPLRASDGSIVVGALPQRSSLLLHGLAPVPTSDSAMQQDLRTLARDQHRDPDQVLRDYATQQPFDEAVRTAETADVGFADAVFHPGAKAISALRFSARPPQQLLDVLRHRYPGDLRIEWGERLVGDRDRDVFSSAVFAIARDIPNAGHPMTGIDGAGRLTLHFDGSATPRDVADALIEDPRLQRMLVDGQLPTEVRITHVDDATATNE